MGGAGRGGGGGDVFKLVGHDRDRSAKLTDGVEIVIGRLGVLVGDLRRRAIRFRAEHVDAVAQRLGGVGKHASELPAAEHAERCALGNRVIHPYRLPDRKPSSLSHRFRRLRRFRKHNLM